MANWSKTFLNSTNIGLHNIGQAMSNVLAAQAMSNVLAAQLQEEKN